MNYETFKKNILNYLIQLKLPGPHGEFLYKDYLSLPADNRSDDEQNIVDMRITTKLLDFLGYPSTDWVYNKIKDKNRPDFVIKVGSRVVFFIEDKRTNITLDEETGQIKRYLESVSNIGLLFNGHEIIGLRRVVGETIPLFRLNFKDVFQDLRPDNQTVLPIIEQDASSQLEQLFEIFRKSRYENIQERIDSLAIPEEVWAKKVKSILTFQDNFITETQGVIYQLSSIAFTSLTAALRQEESLEVIRSRYVEEWQECVSKVNPLAIKDMEGLKQAASFLGARLGYLNDNDIGKIKPFINRLQEQNTTMNSLRAINDRFQYQLLEEESTLGITARYRRWVDLQRTYEEGSKVSELGVMSRGLCEITLD